MSRNDGKIVRCSFCRKSQGQVQRLIAGSGAYVCNGCVQLCTEILEYHQELAEEGRD